MNHGENLDRAVAPNLFDALADPELIFGLVLANLMSPRLWKLRSSLLRQAPSGGGGLREIQQLIDRHFEHVAPSRIAAMNGVFALDAEAARLGSGAVEGALSKILSTVDWRVRRGTLDKSAFPLDLIGQRKFPAYVYSTIDEAWASRRLLQHRKHKPLGLTCCLDEAAILIALGLILPAVAVEDFTLLGSPAHYSVLGWNPADTWWFYTKHDLFAAADWSGLVAQRYAGMAQAAFDDRLPNFDRIVTASGSYAFGTNTSSLAERHLAAIAARIDAFFGYRLAQLDRALRQPRDFVPASDPASIICTVVAEATDALTVQRRLRRAALERGEPSALRALYAFRSLDLPDLEPYLAAARRSSQIGARLGSVMGIDDALRAVKAMAGNASVFDDPDRIAMPDETVRFGTGTDRDKALLLHVLLERVLGGNDPAVSRLETLITEAGSYVRAADFCISTTRMARVPNAQGAVRYRIADWPLR